MRIVPICAVLALSVLACDGVEPPGETLPGTNCRFPTGYDLPELPLVSTGSPDALYAEDAMPLFELEVGDAGWADMCTKAKAYADYLWERAYGDDDVAEVGQEYTRGNLILQGTRFADVGVRFRGRTTMFALFYDGRDPIPGAYNACLNRRLPRKPSFKVSIDKFGNDASIAGQQVFNIVSREGSDSAYLREVLAQRLTNQFGVEASRAAHARLCVDEAYEGLFSLVEEADTQRFLNQHFPGAEDGGLWKIEADGEQSWRSRWDDSGGWVNDYEPKAGTDEEDPGVLKELLEIGADIDDGQTGAAIDDEIDRLVDVDQWLREIAIEMSIPDFDGMFGNHKNHLLYAHPDGFRIIPYDRDLAFVDLVDYSGGQCEGDILGSHPCWASTREGPAIAQYLVDTRRDQYLATVEAFVDEVLVEGEIENWILGRADAMAPWIAADRWYQADSPACDFDPECLFFTTSGWEYAARTSLVEDVRARIASVRAQVNGTSTCANPCGD